MAATRRIGDRLAMVSGNLSAGELSALTALASAAMLVLALGDRLERRFAVLAAGAAAAGALSALPLAALALDGLILMAALALAMSSKARWTLFAAAFQLLTVGTRSLEAFRLEGDWPTDLALQTWTLALAATLVIGAAGARLHHRRKDSP